MSASAPVDAVLTAGSKVGKYFSLVSLLPSFMFVVYATWLLMGRALGRDFDGGAGLQGIVGLGLEGWIVVGLASFALAVVVHPLLYSFTQLLEGYWGSSRIAVSLATWRIRFHLARMDELEHRQRESHDFWVSRAYRSLPAEQRASLRGPSQAEVRQEIARELISSPGARRFLRSYIEEQAAARTLSTYPMSRRRTMPTRLGNAWRRHEDTTGRQYGLRPVVVSPHLSLVADPDHYAYVRDQGEEVDLAVRVTMLGLMATLLSVLWLANDGQWAVIVFAPFLVAYMAYIGAVSAVGSYSVALATVLDLDRFRLYEHLRLEPPTGSVEEKQQGMLLCDLLTGAEVDLRYRTADVSDGPGLKGDQEDSAGNS